MAESDGRLKTMVRRSTICALAAVMVLCVAPPVESRAPGESEKCVVVWLDEARHKKAIERETAARKSYSPPQACFPEPGLLARHPLAFSFEGRAPPFLPTAS